MYHRSYRYGGKRWYFSQATAEERLDAKARALGQAMYQSSFSFRIVASYRGQRKVFRLFDNASERHVNGSWLSAETLERYIDFAFSCRSI